MLSLEHTGPGQSSPSAGGGKAGTRVPCSHHLSYFWPHPQIWARKLLPVSWLLCGPRRYASSNFKVNGKEYTFGSRGGGWRPGLLGVRKRLAVRFGHLQKGPESKGYGGWQWGPISQPEVCGRFGTGYPRSLWGYRSVFSIGLCPRGSWEL